MNPELPKTPREELEAKLTALLLGELPAEEAFALGRAIEKDPELAKIYARLEQTIGLVRQTTATEKESSTQADNLKLSEERREKLLAHFKTVKPREFAETQERHWSWVVPVGAAAALMAVLAAMLLPALSKGKSRSMMLATRSEGKDRETPRIRASDRLAPAAAPDAIIPGTVTVTASGGTARASVASTPIALPSTNVYRYTGDATHLMRGAEKSISLSGADFADRDGAVSYAANDQNVQRDYLVGGRGGGAGTQVASVPIAANTATAVSPAQTAVEESIRLRPNSELAGGTGSAGLISEPARQGIVDRNVFGLKPPANAVEEGKKPIPIDPSTGLPVATVTPFAVDPTTGLPIKPPEGWPTDPTTGLPATITVPALNYPPPAETEMFRRRYGLANGVTSQELAAKTAQPKDASDSHRLGWPTVTNIGLTDRDHGSVPYSAPQVAQVTKSTEQVPILGDIPSLGKEFRSESKSGQAADGLTIVYDSNFAASINSPTNWVSTAGTVPTRTLRLPDKSADRTNLSLAYLDAKKKLEDLQRNQQLLTQKIVSEGGDRELPESAMVEIVDQASPERAEKAGIFQKLREEVTGGVQRTARVKIDHNTTDVSSLAQSSGANYDPYFIQTETEVIRSEVVLGKVIDALNLSQTWGKKQGKDHALSKTDTLALLNKKLDIRTEPNTSLLNIRIKSDNPEEAAKIANSIAQAYKDHRLEQRRAFSRGGIEALEDRFKQKEKEIEVAQRRVEDFRRDLQIPDASVNADPRVTLLGAEMLRNAAAARLKMKAELQRGTNLLNRLKALQADQLVQAVPKELPDALFSTLLEQKTIAEQNLENQKKKYGPADPEVLRAIKSIEDLNQKLQLRAAGLIQSLEAKNAASGEALKQLEMQLENAKEADLPAKGKPTADPTAPIPQPDVLTRDNAFSTFSLNVSDVSFKLAAASLEKGQMPEPASIRSEEFINAFDYHDPEPAPGAPVAFAWERARYPFAHNRDLLRFSIKTATTGRQAGRPLNIVVLLDSSGSMERADRVQIIREALRVLAGQLHSQDKLSVVTFARTPRLWVDGVAGDKAGKVAEEVGGLAPQGGTNLEEAMNLAYQTAARHYIAYGINRIVLLTDGAANLGDIEPESLKQKVEAQRKQGIALDCFGIGWEGFNDDLLEVLSRNGDGRYEFINTPEEAATEFAGQLAGALHVAASDVKVQVEFNPKRVTAYRQIGYAKHQLTKEQFRDNSVDAAELGAAESGNALYVIETNPAGEGPLATVRVRYKVPGTSDYREQEWAVPYTGNAVPLEQASPAMRLAASASAFSEWLAGNPCAAEVTCDKLLGYLSGVPDVYGTDARPKKLEWMVRQAKSVAGK